MACQVTCSDSYRDGRMFKVKRGFCTVKHDWYEVPMVLNSWVRWQNGGYIQDAAPELRPEQREFWITGLTPAEWNSIFPEDE